MWSLGGLLLLGVLQTISGYSSGPPSNVCDGMTPNHGPSPQASQPPFTITTSKNTYSPNEEIQVTIQGSGGSKFKGFFVQPRPSANDYTTVGAINTLPANTKNPCENEAAGKNVAISHSAATEKTSLTFTWTAPSSDVGDVVFVYTVVQVKATFWVKQTSAALTFQGSGGTNPTTNPPTNPPSTSGTTTPTTPSTTDTIDRDSACEVSKNCFPSVSDCTTDCDYLVSWFETGDDVQFTVQRKATSSSYYIAIGFSKDFQMGDDSVATCISDAGQVKVVTSYNPDSAYKYNEPMTPETFGVTFMSGSYSNGVLTCTFKRKIDADLATNALGRRKRATASNSTFFDLNDPHVLLVAHGAAPGGSIQKHTELPKTSSSHINFLQAAGTSSTTPTPSNTGTITKNSECGSTLGCYHDCDGNTCESFLLTWKDEGDDIIFSLSCKRTANSYCAIGLSSDDKMGDDSVFECISNDRGVPSLFVSYNDGRSNSRLTEVQYGLSDLSLSHQDGVLTCNFRRKKTAALAEAALSGGSGRKKRATAGSSTYFDMNQDWTLLYAYGGSSFDFISKHTVLPKPSSQVADFQSFDDIGTSDTNITNIKLHGILMSVAWLFLATYGMFMARHFKQVWPEGMEWCGDKRWFVFHRGCMVLTFLTVATSFVIIFVHAQGYAQIIGNSFQKSHPVLGIVIMGLTLLNPIMAAFRPHPGTRHRPVFNFFHILVGISAYVCSIVNIFSGSSLTSAMVPDSTRIVLYVYCGWVGLVDIVCHIHTCMNKRRGSGEAYEMKDINTGEMEAKPAKVDTFKVGMAVLHFVVLLGLVIAVCVLIARGEHADHDHDEH